MTEPVQSIQTTERRSHQIESADPTHWLVEQKEIISGQLPARRGKYSWRKKNVEESVEKKQTTSLTMIACRGSG